MPKLPYYFADDEKVVKVKDLIIFFDDLHDGEFLPENKKHYQKLKDFFKTMDRHNGS
jgi:hypothetical protein